MMKLLTPIFGLALVITTIVVGFSGVAQWAVLLFGGRGRISSIMGDFAKGIKSFRKGLEDEPEAKDPKNLEEAKPELKSEAKVEQKAE